MRTNPTNTRTLTAANGRTLTVEPISLYFRNKLRLLAERELRHEKPEPPTYENELTGARLPNVADRDYLEALEHWQVRVNAALFARCIAMAVVVDPETLQAALVELQQQDGENSEQARFAAYLAEEQVDPAELETPVDMIFTLPGGQHPKVLYALDAVLERNMDDFYRLIQLLMAERELEDAVQSAAESFQGDVQGEVDLDDHSAVVGAAV